MQDRLIDLTLPIFTGAPIWSPEPKTIIADSVLIGRNYGGMEQMNMKVFYMCGHAGTHWGDENHGANTRDQVDPVRDQTKLVIQ